MEIVDITNNYELIKETYMLSMMEWGHKRPLEEYIKDAEGKALKLIKGNNDKVIFVLGLIDNNELIGFISLYKYDGDERRELTPWYATMYVKKEYRGLGYSKLLNDALKTKAKKLGYTKLYLKSDLKNYYEKFGAIKFDKLSNGEDLFYMDL